MINRALICGCGCWFYSDYLFCILSRCRILFWNMRWEFCFEGSSSACERQITTRKMSSLSSSFIQLFFFVCFFAKISSVFCFRWKKSRHVFSSYRVFFSLVFAKKIPSFGWNPHWWLIIYLLWVHLKVYALFAVFMATPLFAYYFFFLLFCLRAI